MTLHETTDLVKKAGLGSAIGVAGIIVIVILIRIGMMIYAFYFPPKIEPPTTLYGMLPKLQFPTSQVAMTNFTYVLQNTSGSLPTKLSDIMITQDEAAYAKLPDRISIFPIIHPEPDLINLDIAKTKITDLRFTKADESTPADHKELGDPYYEWEDEKEFNRRIRFNINTFDFVLISNYLSSRYVVEPQYLPDENTAIRTVTKFLDVAKLMPNDIDLTKTNTKNNSVKYITYPELYAVQTTSQGTVLVKATSLSNTNVIRVELYQKNIEYELITGEAMELKPKVKVNLPILYPNPPYSTMDFKVASGQNKADVVEANFTHQSIDTTETKATYRIKTPQIAWDELIGNKAYIASYYGTDSNIFIKNIILAYYLGAQPQAYLMPIYVFEGNNGFFAYVSAVTDDQIQQ